MLKISPSNHLDTSISPNALKLSKKALTINEGIQSIVCYFRNGSIEMQELESIMNISCPQKKARKYQCLQKQPNFKKTLSKNTQLLSNKNNTEKMIECLYCLYDIGISDENIEKIFEQNEELIVLYTEMLFQRQVIIEEVLISIEEDTVQHNKTEYELFFEKYIPLENLYTLYDCEADKDTLILIYLVTIALPQEIRDFFIEGFNESIMDGVKLDQEGIKNIYKINCFFRRSVFNESQHLYLKDIGNFIEYVYACPPEVIDTIKCTFSSIEISLKNQKKVIDTVMRTVKHQEIGILTLYQQ